jgi:hypothetical protein
MSLIYKVLMSYLFILFCINIFKKFANMSQTQDTSMDVDPSQDIMTEEQQANLSKKSKKSKKKGGKRQIPKSTGIKKKAISTAQRSGLKFPVGRIRTWMKNNTGRNIGGTSAVYTAATLEGVTEAILGNCIDQLKKKLKKKKNGKIGKIRISPRMLDVIMRDDVALCKILDANNFVIMGAGFENDTLKLMEREKQLKKKLDQIAHPNKGKGKKKGKKGSKKSKDDSKKGKKKKVQEEEESESEKEEESESEEEEESESEEEEESSPDEDENGDEEEEAPLKKKK